MGKGISKFLSPQRLSKLRLRLGDRRPSVLLAAGDDETRKLMERSLGDQFRITSCVSDGFILLRNAVDGSPDLIVADFEIPGIDGIEAAARLRSLQTSAKFVVVSPHAAPELIEEALEAGAAAYVLHRDVEEELLIAAHAALAGRQFISRSCR